jgi:3-oxoacyl-[acyl-carrier protein] reductase
MMFSKNLAVEVIKDNIRVNTINPGLILTEGLDRAGEAHHGRRRRRPARYLQNVADEQAPIKRFGTVEELTNFFVFLCSERVSYSVGSTYFVDGGWLRTV